MPILKRLDYLPNHYTFRQDAPNPIQKSKAYFPILVSTVLHRLCKSVQGISSNNHWSEYTCLPSPGKRSYAKPQVCILYPETISKQEYIRGK